MSDVETKLQPVVTRPGRASCFLGRHLEGRPGFQVLALDVHTRAPSLVAVQPADLLSVWEVVGTAVGDEESRRAGPRCELAAEYRGVFDFETKTWGAWRLLAEYPSGREAPASPARVVAVPALSGRRTRRAS